MGQEYGYGQDQVTASKGFGLVKVGITGPTKRCMGAQ